MIATALADVAAAVGAPAPAGDHGALVVTSVTTDSRAAAPGALFVAVAGERTDGHDHAGAAVAAGAVAVLASRPVEAAGAPVLLVPDTVTALASLASAVLAARRAGDAPLHVLALTGSSGKTSTKDLLAGVLAATGEEVVAPPGSYNNELGLPLTVLGITATTRHLVLEMGARGGGHVAWLASVAPPDVGAVLNVGSAHLGEFGSRAAIAAAKGELVEALPDAAEGGVAVLFADDPLVAAMAGRTRAAVVTAGRSASSDVAALDVSLDGGRASFTLVDGRAGGAGSGDAGGGEVAARRAPVALRLVGEHHVDNAVVAAAMALSVGVPLETVAAVLGSSGPASPHRMALTERPDGVTVVDDAYNANPESVRAALRALTALRGPAKERRTWAVLGEMLELGGDRIAEHDRVGRYAVRLDVSRLVVVGDGARPLHLGAVMEGSWGEESAWVPDADAALELLAAEIAPGDVVLVKGSHSTGLHVLADALAAGAAPARRRDGDAAPRGRLR